MVLCRGQGQGIGTVTQAEKAGLFAVKKFFHHDFSTCLAKSAFKAVFDRSKGLIQRPGNGNALAGGQSVRLDDNRRAHLAGIGLGLGCVVEAHIGTGRNIEACTKILGKAL